MTIACSHFFFALNSELSFKIIFNELNIVFKKKKLCPKSVSHICPQPSLGHWETQHTTPALSTLPEPLAPPLLSLKPNLEFTGGQRICLQCRTTWVQSLSWEDLLEKGKATHSNILAWRIPWTVQSMGLQRVGHDWATFTFTFQPRITHTLFGLLYSSHS